MEEKKIRQLIDRFLGGETSNAEEQTLYEYFGQDEIPASLRKYQRMFQWYAGGGVGQMEQAPARRVALRPRLFLQVAASLLLLLGVGFGYRQYQRQQREFAIYEGSYIIREGRKITDLRQILPELKATEREVNEMLSQNDQNPNIPVI